jgi:hypothetical protein
MLKSGDVLVLAESKLLDALAGAETYPDLRQATSAAKLAIEFGTGDEGVVILRVERIGRPKLRLPAFDCAFDDADAP